MFRLATVLIAFLTATAIAQTASPQQLVKQTEAAIAEISNYCEGVDTFLQYHPARLFAVASSASSEWREFADRGDWQRAGKPVPAALVWMKGGKTVAVRLAFTNQLARVSIADYCFRTDGTLARVRTAPETQVESDAKGLYGQLIFGSGLFLLPDGRVVRTIIDGDPRPLKTERTATMRVAPPEYRKVADLPFAAALPKGLLRVSPSE